MGFWVRWTFDLSSRESFIPSYTCLSACPGARETASTCLGKQARGFSAPDSQQELPARQGGVRQMSVACGSPQSPVSGSACQTGAAHREGGCRAVAGASGEEGRLGFWCPRARYSWTNWALQKRGKVQPSRGGPAFSPCKFLRKSTQFPGVLSAGLARERVDE